MAGRDSQVVHPPAVPIETDHYSSHQFDIDRAHKKQLGLFSEFACNVSARVVPGARKTALLPQRDNRRFIDWLKDSDLHIADDAQRFALPRASAVRALGAPLAARRQQLKLDLGRAIALTQHKSYVLCAGLAVNRQPPFLAPRN